MKNFSVFFLLILVLIIPACKGNSNNSDENDILISSSEIKSFGADVFNKISEGNIGDLISLLPSTGDYTEMFENSTLTKDEKLEKMQEVDDLVRNEQLEFINNHSAFQNELKKQEIDLLGLNIFSIDYTIQNISQIIDLRLDLIFKVGEDIFWIKLTGCKLINGKWFLGKGINLYKQGSGVKNNYENKFLITNNSVGFFRIGGAWRDIAENDYKFEYHEGYGICFDAGCDGAHDLGSKLKKNKYGIVQNPTLTIGAVPFDKNEESKNKHKYNPNVFFSESDNLRGWYYKDKIKYVLIFSELFKTKEQVGVGSTLESVQKIFGKLNINVGSLTGEPEPYPITFNLKPYPQILFILDIEDCKAFIPWEGDWDNIDWDSYEKSMHYRSLELIENTTLSVNDFKKNSKIKTIIVGNSY